MPSVISVNALKVFKTAAILLIMGEVMGENMIEYHSLTESFARNLETLPLTRFRGRCGLVLEAVEIC